jgi:hypothetical protein
MLEKNAFLTWTFSTGESPMSATVERLDRVEPHLIRRTCGGWLAITPKGSALSVGVTAPTEREAKEKFCYVLARWLEIIRDTKNTPNT